MSSHSAHHLLVFSAQSAVELVSQLKQASGEDLATLAAVCAQQALDSWRVAIVARDAREFDERRARAVAHLSSGDARRPLSLAGAVFTGVASAPPRTACLFPGLGLKPTSLLKDLCARYPAVDVWSESLRRVAARPASTASSAAPDAGNATSSVLDSVLLGDLAMWALLQDVGLTCDAMLGHSFGENAVLVASGMVDDYAAIVRLLGELREETGLGSAPARSSLGMLALSAASRPLIERGLAADPPQICISLDNCPQQIVVWGESDALAEVERAARERKEVVFRLPSLEQPVHTPLLAISEAALLAGYERINVHRPRVAAWSAATAERFPDDPGAIRSLLAHQWRTTVRFRESIARLHAEGVTTFVEVGAGDRLTGFVRDTLRGSGATAIATNIDGRDIDAQLCAAFAQLIASGHNLDLRRLRPATLSAVAPVIASPAAAETGAQDAWTHTIATHVAELLDFSSTAGLDIDRGFFDLGLGSIGCIALIDRLAAESQLDLPQTLPFDFPSIKRLAQAIADAEAGTTAARPVVARRNYGGPIAIVGIGCRFPGGADSPDAYWRQLVNGVDAVTSEPSDRWDPSIFNSIADADARQRASFSARLDDIRGFDAQFFGMSPREATALDPQQRLLLEVTWEALEHAAIDPHSLAGTRTGVFVGISHSEYSARLSIEERLAAGGYLATGNMSATAAGRVSFVLGLHGPAMAIDTACSSSLAAVHLAVQSLRSGESDVAIAGGVNLLMSPETTVFLSQAQALSREGRSAAFDASADGYVRGEGCGMVILKRLADATAANDSVIAVIRGSALNHDGRTSGLTVPNGLSQREVLRAALADAAIAADQVSYVEAHGTGTSLGDPIEINALDEVFNGGGRAAPLRLGAVKTGIGHLEAAAGVAGLIKVALQHQRRAFTPTLHFKSPNPRARFRDLAKAVVTEFEPSVALETTASGVSSFGISGTNAHVIVTAAPPAKDAVEQGALSPLVLPISAASDRSMRTLAERIADRLERDPSADLRVVARTLATGRAHLSFRRAIVATTMQDAIEGFRTLANGDRLHHEPGSVAARYEGGESIAWRDIVGPGPRMVLPTYPFQRERYWIDARTAAPRPPAPDATASHSTVRNAMASASPDRRAEIAGAYLQAIVAAVLDAPPDRAIDVDRPMSHAGLDSLMALQLSAQLQQDCGITVAAGDLVDKVTLSALAASLVSAVESPTGELNFAPATGERRTLTRSPLSYGQRALWFLSRLAPESFAYNQSMPLHVDGGAAEWKAAAALLLDRHGMLRTRFRDDAGVPYQIVEPALLRWEESDAIEWTAAQLEHEMSRSHQRPFALADEPPIRFHWFTTRDGGRLLITMHHIACDAWSLEMMRHELAALADGVRAGRPASLPAASHSYQDFVRWQQQMLSSARGEALWEFWSRQLAAPRGRIDLPADRPRPAVQTYNGDSVSVAMPKAVAEAVRAFARERGVTPFVALLAMFMTVLHRWTGQRDLIVGVPTAGRGQPQFAGTVGYFVEPVAVRVAVEPPSTFISMLAAVHAASAAALAHGEFPFPLLVERLHPERDASRAPIFDITFNYLSRRGRASAGPATIEVPQADGKFDLTLTMLDDEDGLRGAFGFNTDLFDRATVESIAASFVRTMHEVLRQPEQALSSIALSEGDAFAPVLTGKSTSGTPARIDRMIEEHVRSTPSAIAVVAEDGQLTYRELWEQSAALAEQLSACGVGPDVPVALWTPRSTRFIAGMLAILRAGGAYVPLDVAMPAALRDRLLQRAGIDVIVDGTGGTFTVRGAVATAARPGAGLSDLAYVIFTSGSTGEPKAVAIEHAALSNYVSSIIDDLALAPASRYAMVSTVAADLGHTVLFPSLATGGTLHVVGSDVATEPRRFADYIGRHAIDYLKIVPSHLRALSDGGGEVLPRIAVILGGESTGLSWLRPLLERSGCRAFNHYGPTETTVGVMTYALDPDHPPSTATLPLNRAVANTAIWLLDGDRQPVPRGARGEIYVSGRAVARGYLGDAAQTAAMFVELADGTRAYRTGDIARQMPGGELLLLGRDDRQVKLRGYRVELAQVERVVASHPAVRQACVLPDRDGPTASKLWAWVVLDGGDAQALSAWLGERLPGHMVPSIVAVEAIPLTPNGKVDAARLRAGVVAGAAGTARIDQRDRVASRVSRIWQDVLGVSEPAADADFFALGGHSLSAVQLASRVAGDLGVDIPLSVLFMHPTFERLCDWVRAAAQPASSTALVAMRMAGDEPALICFPGAGGSLLYFRDLVQAIGDDRPVWGADAVGLDGRTAIPLSIEALAAVYVDAWLSRSDSAPPLLIGHSFGALVAFEVARQLEARGRAVEGLIVLDNEAPGLEAPTDLDTRDWSRHIATRIERLYGVDLKIASHAVGAGGDWLSDVLLRSGVLPAGTTRDYLSRYVELYRANVRAAAAYAPRGPIAAPIHVFAAGDRDAALDRRDAEGDLGWARWSRQPVEVTRVPGTHISMLLAPNAPLLASALRPILHRRAVERR